MILGINNFFDVMHLITNVSLLSNCGDLSIDHVYFYQIIN